ncbi:hypothetical protein [Spirosoma sp.]|uniref:hypothetical protein n=1 Tax=Spirosoma sp. TaxID=1899569 RepID=UPI003B3B4C2F
MKHAFAFLFLYLPLVGVAQTLTIESPARPRNTVYLEVLGSGGAYSLNYERFLFLRQKQAYGFRVGSSYFGGQKAIALIGELFALAGKGNHHGDFGIGLTRVNQQSFGFYASGSTARYTTLYAVPRVGYRYQKPTGGLMVRVGFTPFIKMTKRVDSTSHISSWFGLSIGYNF